MSAYAWKRRRLSRIRLREDLKMLNGPGGLGALLRDLASTRRDRWGFRWRKAFTGKPGHLIT
jgi:hypothetical protein